MAQRAVLVKRLVSIEDLGDADILFTDKTGTLTEGEIRYREAVGPTGAVRHDLNLQGLFCGELDFEHGGTPLGNTLDLAIWRSLEPKVAEAELARRAASRRCRSRSTAAAHRSSWSVTAAVGSLCKGAAEEVLARCSTARLSTVPSRSRRRVPDRRTLEGLLDHGHRVLALAERPIESKPRYGDDDERELELLGFLVFADPPKQDAAESIRRLQRLGIELKVLTGDNERTAAHVCAEVGSPVKGLVRGERPRRRSTTSSCRTSSRRTTVFARVEPGAEGRAVAAAQRNGDDVAFLGDGVNDAVALHRADVGISVDTAVDVAKEAADVLLLEKSLRAIADGVVEGRRIFANTTKYVLMGTSSNFGNMFSAAGASLFLSFLPMLPSQILLNNMLYDCSELTIPTDAWTRSCSRGPSTGISASSAAS